MMVSTSHHNVWSSAAARVNGSLRWRSGRGINPRALQALRIALCPPNYAPRLSFRRRRLVFQEPDRWPIFYSTFADSQVRTLSCQSLPFRYCPVRCGTGRSDTSVQRPSHSLSIICELWSIIVHHPEYIQYSVVEIWMQVARAQTSLEVHMP